MSGPLTPHVCDLCVCGRDSHSQGIKCYCVVLWMNGKEMFVDVESQHQDFQMEDSFRSLES